ncbi:colicin E3/pyocin S6 family cytotoxin [Nocardia tenerifensis]|uniref:colicin E3/pyocin S6 family cytotoxin n=1 Tax=Nocardia tenerifensis TaxID=228006 RepID=UPI0007C5091B|nr:colicin E3/pyocin S6 family cytotoxin [Nocardia tenerifensis]
MDTPHRGRSGGHRRGYPKARPVKKVGPRYRQRREDSDGNLYEWDYQHGAMEKYSKNGKHLGEYDANSGEQNKPPEAGRKPGR